MWRVSINKTQVQEKGSVLLSLFENTEDITGQILTLQWLADNHTDRSMQAEYLMQFAGVTQQHGYLQATEKQWKKIEIEYFPCENWKKTYENVGIYI